VDVTEIDGASNNSVDDIRDLRERVKYAPSGGKYKVYIIDEVHMLSTSAFNALLKTLEEPPSHVIFVLATTEMKKIPATVISRCQHMPFRRISSSMIKARLKQISDAEEFTYHLPRSALSQRRQMAAYGTL
jgi:DNA polymerase-3 subunit gamma/tau